MARLYEPGEGEGSCPGEENCETWLSSAEPRFCPSCPKRQGAESSEPEAESGEPETVTERVFLNRVDRFRQERNSGRDVYQWMDAFDWEALLLWDETIEDYRRGHEIRIEQMFQMISAAMTR